MNMLRTQHKTHKCAQTRTHTHTLSLSLSTPLSTSLDPSLNLSQPLSFPADLWGECEEVLELFAVLKERRETWALLEVDLVEEPDANHLPQDAKHNVRCPSRQVLGPNVGGVDANGCGRVHNKRLVLANVEAVELALVQCTLVNGAWLSNVDKLGKHEAVLHNVKQLLGARVSLSKGWGWGRDRHIDTDTKTHAHRYTDTQTRRKRMEG